MKTPNFIIAALISALAPMPAFAGIDVTGEIDLLEMHIGKGEDHFLVDSVFVIGGDKGAAVVKLEGGSDIGPRVDEVTGQLLYALPFSESATLLAGVRHDFREGSDLTHAAVAIELAVAPWLDAEHYLYLSQDGDLTGVGMLVGTVDLADSLALEPRLAVGWAAAAIPVEETGAGISDVELSLRLRKQVTTGLNAYVGVIHERLVGGTRDIARNNGESGQVTRAVIGIGMSF